MDEYTELKAFWDKAFDGLTPEKITEREITDQSFRTLVSDCLNAGSRVLDYGCGTGWAAFDLALSGDNITVDGIDPSENAIRYANACTKLSGLHRVLFFAGDESVLGKLDKQYDLIVSFNVLDVVPDDVAHRILTALKAHAAPGATVVIGINPDLDDDFLRSLGYRIDGCLLHKDGILRGNLKSEEAWIALLGQYFRFAELRRVSLSEREQAHKRRVFILKNDV